MLSVQDKKAGRKTTTTTTTANENEFILKCFWICFHFQRVDLVVVAVVLGGVVVVVAIAPSPSELTSRLAGWLAMRPSRPTNRPTERPTVVGAWIDGLDELEHGVAKFHYLQLNNFTLNHNNFEWNGT